MELNTSIVKTLILVFLSIILVVIAGLFFFKGEKKQTVSVPINLESEAKEVSIKLRNLLQEESYLGCLYWPQLDLYDDFNQTILKTGFSVVSSSEGGLPMKLKNKLNPESSLLKIQTMSQDRTPLTHRADNNSKLLYVKSPSLFKKGQKIIIADCLHAELNQVEQIDKKHNQLNLKFPLHYNYDNYPVVGEMVQHLLFVQQEKRGHQGLYFIKGRREENLARSVAQMRINQQSKAGEVFEVEFVLNDVTSHMNQKFMTTINFETAIAVTAK